LSVIGSIKNVPFGTKGIKMGYKMLKLKKENTTVEVIFYRGNLYERAMYDDGRVLWWQQDRFYAGTCVICKEFRLERERVVCETCKMLTTELETVYNTPTDDEE